MLIIARHGRTESNARGLLLGRADPDLDSTGREQAGQLAASLERVDRIVTSPLARTRQTAQAVADTFGLAAEVDERWIELDYGDWDERPISEISAGTWAQWRADTDFRPPGGETLAELGERVRQGAADLVDAAAERNILVVSHVSPIKAAVVWALGVGDEVTWRLFVGQASQTTLATDRGHPRLVRFNDVSHLS
ncbi:MAG: histidine phosphatase family protein [Actinomycetia bacterium]|nr:histidine phosphatase family protein [Actinomycetes bacterium]MCP3911329.1 histidine phosphatase family protein [Actinomycetes bacterium]MCP4085701.1 histidine phosphatase family protein [Actinomycetes bacterium]